jgi:hypothetical protein
MININEKHIHLHSLDQMTWGKAYHLPPNRLEEQTIPGESRGTLGEESS